MKRIQRQILDINVRIVVDCRTVQSIQGGPKSKPLPNDRKIVLNRIKACQWD